MTNKDKWVELFEKVVGRKPTANEFMAGKAVDFDLKQIRTIAGLDASGEKAEQVFDQEGQVPVQPEIPNQPLPQMPNQQMAYQQPQPVQTPPKIKKKLTVGQKIFRGLIWTSVLAALGLGGSYWYFDQQTGADVAVETFSQALDSNDYDEVAQLLSTKKDKWTKEEARAFVSYLGEAGIDPKAELEKLVENGAKTVYNDDRGNKLLGLEETGKLFGIFPEYRVATYPIKVSVKTNMDNLKINDKAIEKDKEIELGDFKIASQELRVTGKTDLGEINSPLAINPEDVSDNQVLLTLDQKKQKISAKLPESLPETSKHKLVINGKDIGDGLTKEVTVFNNQELEIHAIFSYEGADYTTENSKSMIDTSSTEAVSIPLTISEDVANKVKKAKEAKEEKERAEKEAKEAAEKLEKAAYDFMVEYRDAMYSSINSGVVSFGKYYDSGVSDYQTMVEYVNSYSSSIRRQTSEVYEKTGFEKISDNEYKIHIRSKFRIEYYSGVVNTLDQNQTFTLRKDGDSFKITNVNR